MTLDDVLFAASCAAPFVVAYGAARLWVDRRRLFRRDPPHLRGRVPVECGEGNKRPASTGVGVEDWMPPRDSVGRAFLKSALPLAPELEAQRSALAAYRARVADLSQRTFTTHREWWLCRSEVEKEAMRLQAIKAEVAHYAQQRRETEQETAARTQSERQLDPRTLTYSDGTSYEVRLMIQAGMATQRPDMQVVIRQDRPSPAENARRYTSEEETW